MLLRDCYLLYCIWYYNIIACDDSNNVSDILLHLKGVSSDSYRTAQPFQIAATISSMILNWLQWKFTSKAVTNEKAMFDSHVETCIDWTTRTMLPRVPTYFSSDPNSLTDTSHYGDTSLSLKNKECHGSWHTDTVGSEVAGCKWEGDMTSFCAWTTNFWGSW